MLYNGDGLRTAKSGGSRNTQYYLLDGTYAGEKTVIDNKTYYISYMYDENGSPLGINRNGTAFHFAKNMQGDVIAILDTSGSIVARYNYDAWGNCTVTDASGNGITDPKNIANCNPFRYRGYMYDQETGLYYLRTRYYDPVVGRFLNVDDPELLITTVEITDKNLYSYCLNNPVNCVDTTGTTTETLKWWYGTMWWLCGADATLPVGDVVYVIGGVVALGIGCLISQTEAISIPVPTYKSKSESKSDSKDKVDAIPNTSQTFYTYYHITTPENAAVIMNTGVMVGSVWEGGFVYAWLRKPSQYAIDNSGAHFGAIISFETNISFCPDPNIEDSKVLKYGPVVSVVPGPIVVKNVRIVG